MLVHQIGFLLLKHESSGGNLHEWEDYLETIIHSFVYLETTLGTIWQTTLPWQAFSDRNSNS